MVGVDRIQQIDDYTQYKVYLFCTAVWGSDKGIAR